MGRPLKGSIRRRGSAVLASVPRRRGATERLEYPFATEGDANDWIERQVKRLEQGLEALPPERAKADGPTSPAEWSDSLFVEMAVAWHHERYVEMHKAKPERQLEVMRNLELHILGPFQGLFELNVREGRQLVKDWIRAMRGLKPLSKNSDLRVAERPYSQQTVTELLWIVSQVIGHARTLGHAVPDYTAGTNIAVAKNAGEQNPKPRPLITLAEAGGVARGLNIIHQLVLWLMRVAGLRISEAYGLDVASFIVDDDGDGYLLVRAQGGRRFFVRDEAGTIHATTSVDNTKTAAGHRLVPLPRQLTELINVIVAVFHTDASGRINTTARLVPTIRSEEGGQSGFRSALERAMQTKFGDDAALEERFVAQDMRRAFGTDLAWDQSIADLAARRAIGHVAGTDVFSLRYTLDSRLKKHLSPVAAAFTEEIARALSSLMIPTPIRPSYRTDLDVREIDARLIELGWQVPVNADFIGVSDTATILGMSETATRRLMGSSIPAVKVRGAWRVKLDDVEAFKARNDDKVLLNDLAEELRVDYHVVYREVQQLGLDLARDTHDERVVVLDPAEADLVRSSVGAAQALHERSAKLAEAVELLGVAHSTIGRWIDAGELELDPETDGSGARFITRQSIDAKRESLGRRRKGVSVETFMRITEFPRSAVDTLLAEGVLVRSRSGALTDESVKTWVIGFRPDLLDSELLAR